MTITSDRLRRQLATYLIDANREGGQKELLESINNLIDLNITPNDIFIHTSGQIEETTKYWMDITKLENAESIFEYWTKEIREKKLKEIFNQP